MADESLGRLSNFLYRDRAETLGACFACSIRALADHFGRVRSDLTSLEMVDGSLSFV